MKSILIFLMFIGTTVCAQTEEVLTNQSVIDLYKLGLGESVVINKIKTSKSNFDVTIKGLTELKKQGLSDAVINAVLENADKNKVSTDQNPNHPLSDHPAGIYYLNQKDSSLFQLLPTLSNDEKTNNLLLKLSGGLTKADTKRCLPGVKAKNKFGEHQPVFYFYIPESDEGSGNFNASAVAGSPNDFILIQFTLNDKQNERCVVVGSYNGYSSKSGVDNSKTIAFQFVKKRKGIYEVTMEHPLAPGEYCFMYADNKISKVFDFSIQ